MRLGCLLALVLVAVPGALRADDGKSVSSIPGPSGPGVDAEPSPPKLVFTYPCSFAYADGKAYEERMLDWQCDYIHASVKNGKDTFNALPTLAAQKAFLGIMRDNADAAHDEYIKKIAEILKAADPAAVPKMLSTGERTKRIAALNVMLSTGVFAAAQPFLWPPREAESYVEKTAGTWPASWHPYLQPIYARAGELQQALKADEIKLIDQASAALDAKIRMNGLRANKGLDVSLDKVFDGGGTHAGGDVSALGLAKSGPAGASVAGAIPVTISDLRAAPPPIPKDQAQRDQRNYFARGYEAGIKRLQNDAQVEFWHAMGMTQTVGDPYGKASLVFQQLGPACAVAAETEALRARGQNVKPEELAREGVDKGYFVDVPGVDGAREGGTPWGRLDALLTDHGVKSASVVNADARQLDEAVRASGDAIVYVTVKGFWEDPKQPDRVSHAVYVTGMEVDHNGSVRGYYVNDTGTNEAARFIPASLFKKVWTKNMVVMHDAPNN